MFLNILKEAQTLEYTTALVMLIYVKIVTEDISIFSFKLLTIVATSGRKSLI